MRMKKIDILILLVIVALTLFLYSLNYNKGISLHDEGRDLCAFEKVLNGQMPYRDFRWVHGPAALYLHSFIFKLFGVNLLYIRQMLIIVIILVLIFSYLLARLIMPRLYSAMAALVAVGYYGFPQYTSDHIYGTLFGLIAVMSILKFVVEGRDLRYLALAGILTGSIFGFMQAMGVFVFSAISLYIILLGKNRKHLFLYMALTTFTIFIIYLFFLINVPGNLLFENLFPHWRLKLMADLGVFPALFGFLQRGFSTDSFNVSRNALLFWLPAVSTAIVIVFLLFRIKNKRFYEKGENKILLLFSIYQAIMLTKLFIDKGVESVVFYTQIGMVLSVYVLYYLTQFIKIKNIQSRALLKAAILLCLILLFLIEITPFTIAHYYGFKDDYKLPFKRAPVYVNQKLGKTLTQVVDYVKTSTDKQDKLICAIYCPMLNFLTERENPLYDNELTPGVFRDKAMEEEAIKITKTNKVKYFAYVKFTHTIGQAEGWGPYIFGKSYAASFFNFIENNYHVEKEFGDSAFPPASLSTILYRRNYE